MEHSQSEKAAIRRLRTSMGQLTDLRKEKTNLEDKLVRINERIDLYLDVIVQCGDLLSGDAESPKEIPS